MRPGWQNHQHPARIANWWDLLYPFWEYETTPKRVYEILVGKEAVNMRRDPLQRVRDECVPTGGLKGFHG